GIDSTARTIWQMTMPRIRSSRGRSDFSQAGDRLCRLHLFESRRRITSVGVDQASDETADTFLHRNGRYTDRVCDRRRGLAARARQQLVYTPRAGLDPSRLATLVGGSG